ncbi:hypothetical protein MG1_00619 [Candida albicans GC75]|nr:hypothetical protein MG1_00619 [Candida albicans GC75]
MYKFTVFIVAFFSLFFQSVIAAPIQQGFRGNVTLYIKSDSEEVNGKTLYTLTKDVGFNEIYIGDYVTPGATFYIEPSLIYQRYDDDESGTSYALTYSEDGKIGVAAGSDGIYISDFDQKSGEIKFSGYDYLYAVHVVDKPAYSASQYAIQVGNPNSPPKNSYKVSIYGRLNWAVL